MSNRDDYEAKLEAIRSIEDSRIVMQQRFPVDVFLQESEELYYWSRDDKEPLTGAGLDWELVTDLPVRCGALREAELIWSVQKRWGKEANREWAKQSPIAHELRKEMIRQFRFAFRKDPQLMKMMKGFAANTSHASMVQNLNDLSVAGRNNIPLLEAIGFDLSLLEKAAEMSSDMAKLLARNDGAKMEYGSAKRIRDQAYTYLKEAVDEIREYGRFVFRNKKERLAGYRSDYIRKLNLRAKTKRKTKTMDNATLTTTGKQGEN